MKRKLKSAVAGVATLAIAGGGLLTFAAAASAAPTTPPWEPDANSAAPYGNLVFYDAAGNVVTSGTNLGHLFDYVAATSAGDSGANKATLYFAAPKSGVPTGSWAASIASGSNTYPNSAAPAPLTGPGFTNPVDTLTGTDANLTAALGGFALDTTAGYADLIQVRMKDSGAGGITSGSSYWSADIAYNQTSAPTTVDGVNVPANGWAQVYPVVATTTTSLTASPTSPQNLTGTQTTGQTVTLTATVSPAESGTVQFFDGTTSLGSAAVSGGTATGTLPTPAEGTHNLTAHFIPTGGTEVQGSTSSPVSYVVNPPRTATSTTLAGPASANQYSAVSFTATETPVPSPDGGSFTVNYAGTGTTTGSGTLGTATEASGTGTVNVSSVTLPAGTYNLTATFTPTSNSYAASTSAPVAFTVNSNPCPGTPPTNGTSCQNTSNVQVTVNPGSLTITTPYTSSNPFTLPAMKLNDAATALTTSATFPNTTAGDKLEVQSSLSGDPAWTVTVTDSDLTCAACKASPVTGEFQTINGENMGLTAGNTTTALPSATFPGSVAFFNIPAPTSPVGPTDTNGGGLKGAPHTFAHSPAGNGTVDMYGTLSLIAPTATQAGTYTGTITFTVG